MGDIEIKVGTVGVQNFAQQLTDAIEDGIRDAAPVIAEELESTAKVRLINAGAVWRGVLLGSFETRITKTGKTWHVVVQNDADQARPLEFGATYEGEGPPLAPLIPWVRTKMVGFQLDKEDRRHIPDADEIAEQAKIEYDGETISVDLINYVDEAVLEKAFWLQQHIKENGIDAIRFMKAAEEHAEQTADDTVADFIQARLLS